MKGLITVVIAVIACSAWAAAESEECARSTAKIYESDSPAVVSLITRRVNPYRVRNRVQRGLGSAFLIDGTKGYAVTNAHVVFGAQSISATLDDGSVRPVRVIGQDAIFDIALVQIALADGESVPSIALGDSDRVVAGDDVFVIGNPLGLEQTLTRGVVSAINRVLPEKPLSLSRPMIQTDAAINPGNSGGPLLDRCGRVIGMATEIVADAHGIGFAVPVNLIKDVLPTLLENGRVMRPWLGFHGQLIGKGLAQVLRTPAMSGLLVEVIEPGSPAEKAGIRGGTIEISIDGSELLWGGDVVAAINGVRLNTPERLFETMSAIRIGQTVRLELRRDEQTLKVEYEVPERPFLPGDLADGASTPVLPVRRAGAPAPVTGIRAIP